MSEASKRWRHLDAKGFVDDKDVMNGVDNLASNQLRHFDVKVVLKGGDIMDGRHREGWSRRNNRMAESSESQRRKGDGDVEDAKAVDASPPKCKSHTASLRRSLGRNYADCSCQGSDGKWLAM